MNATLRALVRERAGERCEYCGLHQDDSPLALLHVEHIVPKVHGGSDDPGNLALACVDCNLHKGPNLTGIDPVTGQVVALFHPRRQHWDEHFARQGSRILGRTPTGRTTVRLLRMNSDDQLALRSL
jgi:5-methylcytosine-specific restriction endonuclease McrA